MNIKDVQALFDNFKDFADDERDRARLDLNGLIVDRLGELKAYDKCADNLEGLKEAKLNALAEVIGSVFNLANIYGIDAEEALNYFKGC